MKEELSLHVPKGLRKYILADNNVTEIKYPVTKYPDKINSLNLKKNKLYSGRLTGIKGQYLIFEDSTVFNIRSNEGLKVEIDIG